MAKKVIVSSLSSAKVKWAFIVSLTQRLRNFTHTYTLGGGIQMQTTVGTSIHTDRDTPPIPPSFTNVELRLRWRKPIKLIKYHGGKQIEVVLRKLGSDQLQRYDSLENDNILHIGVLESYFLNLLTILRGLDSGQRLIAASPQPFTVESTAQHKLDFIYSCLAAFDGDVLQLNAIKRTALELCWAPTSASLSHGRWLRLGDWQNSFDSEFIKGNVHGISVCTKVNHSLAQLRLVLKTSLGFPKPRIRVINVGMNFVIQGLMDQK